MKKYLQTFVLGLLDYTIIPVTRYIQSRTPPPYTVLSELERRTASECADYVQKSMNKALHFRLPMALWDHAFSKRTIEGLIVEFGVYQGFSINHFASKSRETVYGFDSFEGLKEDWTGHESAKGAFDLGGKLPNVAQNVSLIKGWFDQTLPAFLSAHPEPFSFVHIDSDTYEAAKTVFEFINPRIQKGTVIVFDEYFGYRGWKSGEYKAWQEFVSSTEIQYEYLGFSTEQVSIVVTQRH